VLCFDAATGGEVLDVPVIPPVRRYTVNVTDLAVAPDGIHFAATGSDGWGCLHRLADGGAAGDPLDNGGIHGGLKFMDSEHFFVASGNGSVVWNWKLSRRTAWAPQGNLYVCREGVFLGRTWQGVTLWRMTGKAGVPHEFTLRTSKDGF